MKTTAQLTKKFGTLADAHARESVNELVNAMTKETPLDESEVLSIKTALTFSWEVIKELTGLPVDAITEELMIGHGSLCLNLHLQSPVGTASPDIVQRKIAQEIVKRLRKTPAKSSRGFASCEFDPN